MIEQDRYEFKEAFIVMSKASGVKLDKGRASSYFDMLKEYPLRDVLKGMLIATRANSIANTLPMIVAIIEAIEGSKLQIATTAYDLLVLSSTYTSSNVIVFDDPTLDCAIATLGGIAECWKAMTGEYAGIFRKEFEKYYTAHKRSGSAPRIHYHDTGATLCETVTEKGMKPCVSMIHVRQAHQNRKDFVWISDKPLGEIVSEFTGRKLIEGVCEDVRKLIKGSLSVSASPER